MSGLQLTLADLQPDHNRPAASSPSRPHEAVSRGKEPEMTQFTYRLALTTVLLALSLSIWWTAAAAASRYIDRPGTGGPEIPATYGPAGRDGFDWVAAGIGAATTLGVGLVAAGGSVLVLRRRRSAAFS